MVSKIPLADIGSYYLSPLVVDRANTSSTGGVKNRRNASSKREGCQRQALVLNAKREYMTKMVSSTRGGGVKCASSTGGGGFNDKGKGGR